MFRFLVFLFSPKFYFLDLILKELSKNFSYYLKESDLVDKVTKTISKVERTSFYIKLNRSFIKNGNEVYFIRYACQYLEEQKLISISKLPPHDVKYTLTYEGLITVKTGGLFWLKVWNQLKTSTQYIVWIVAILTFVVNYQNIQKYNKVSHEVYDLKHRINLYNQQYQQKLEKLNLKLENQEQLLKNSVKIDTISQKPR
jgi:hypothetical protein